MPADVADLIEIYQEREQRADFRAGQICWLLAEINRDSKKRPVPFSPADFFPSLGAGSDDGDEDEALTAKLEAVGARLEAIT